MEGQDGPVAINNNPSLIRAAQEDMGRLDVLVCGQCHSVFHFIEEFQEHRNKEGVCSKTSHFRENANNEQKAQVWAFLLWKDSQIQQETVDRDSANSWKLYQKWCKMEQNVRESWITAGKTIQIFTKISNAKMQDSPRPPSTPEGAKQTVTVRKVIRNGQPEDIEVKKEPKTEPTTPNSSKSNETTGNKKPIPLVRPRCCVKPRVKPGKSNAEEEEENQEEYPVEKIMAKRFNTKKHCAEYLLKWEGFAQEHNTWESAEVVNTCKYLLEEFERNLAKQKEMREQKAQQQQLQAQIQQNQAQAAAKARQNLQKPVIKPEVNKPGPSTAAQSGRPTRSSKTKAMDQVKQWCGSMKDEENELLGKRRVEFTDSDSEDASAAKRTKADTGSDDDWTGESEDERLGGRSDVIQRAFNRANAQSNGSNRQTTVVSSADLGALVNVQNVTSGDASKGTMQTPVLVANAKGVVKVDPKQIPHLTSGVYMMHRKEGIIKLDSSPSGKLGVKGSQSNQGVLMVQNREGGTVVRKQVLTSSPGNSITPVKVVSKADGSQVVTPMKVIAKPGQPKPRTSLTPKTEPVKIQPKPDPNQMQQIHVVTAVPSPLGIQPRMTTTIRPVGQQQQVQRTSDGRPLLPRPTLRATTPSSVLGAGQVRTAVRTPAPKQVQTPNRPQMVQKRIVSTASPQANKETVIGANQTAQMRPKYTIVASQPGQMVKTASSPVTSQQVVKQSPKSMPGKTTPQSLLSPQQKLIMAKRKAQEQAGVAKTSPRGIVMGTRTPPARVRGKPVANVAAAAVVNKPKETKIVETDGLHMEFQEVGSEDSSEETEPPQTTDISTQNTAAPTAEPESPRPFTLCPLTGRIIGPDGEPMETSEPVVAPQEVQTPTTPTQQAQTPVTSPQTTTATQNETSTVAVVNAETPTTAELVLPSLEGLTDSGGIMRVEMSPGGTTGTIVQSSDPSQISLAVTVSQDLPSLDDSSVSTVSTVAPSSVSQAETIPSESATVATSSVTAEAMDIKSEEKPEESRGDDASNLVTITGEDGVVYQVAGHAEDGQTLLVTRSADGEQQCVYVTTEQQGADGSVLTIDHAVAEAVAQMMPDQVNLTPQFYVKEDEEGNTDNQMVMSIMDNAGTANQEDADSQAQVVAQVVQADDPTPGGTRRVVLLLPDGNLMMTEVDEEQYAALELDK